MLRRIMRITTFILAKFICHRLWLKFARCRQVDVPWQRNPGLSGSKTYSTQYWGEGHRSHECWQPSPWTINSTYITYNIQDHPSNKNWVINTHTSCMKYSLALHAKSMLQGRAQLRPGGVQSWEVSWWLHLGMESFKQLHHVTSEVHLK